MWADNRHLASQTTQGIQLRRSATQQQQVLLDISPLSLCSLAAANDKKKKKKTPVQLYVQAKCKAIQQREYMWICIYSC